MLRLANFAKAEFALNAKQEDGETLRTHLQSAWRQSGIKPHNWPDAKLPEEVKYLWEFFVELNRARGSNGFGPSPLSFSDLHAWATLTGNRLDPWELRAILAIDAHYIASAVPPKGKPGHDR